jgi:hypothetical protein
MSNEQGRRKKLRNEVPELGSVGDHAPQRRRRKTVRDLLKQCGRDRPNCGPGVYDNFRSGFRGRIEQYFPKDTNEYQKRGVELPRNI